LCPGVAFICSLYILSGLTVFLIFPLLMAMSRNISVAYICPHFLAAHYVPCCFS
jgi:hypothetical protein